ncbi:hypothetical protein ACPOLB_03855 [Rubrivivax sp. RP6-9]|uniref:hypothetical protein n=1 Tax=Rubrivivax sp. RP6-9 TaxID=3415750 RepID=UPI003CC58C4A
MLARYARLVCSAALALAALGTALAGTVPPGPPNPRSGDECVAAYEPSFRQQYASGGACTRQCDRIWREGGRGWESRYTACYNQCGAKRKAEHAELMSAREACFDRAKQGQQEVRQKLAEGMELGRKLLNKAEQAHEIVSDPTTFFATKVEERVKNGLFGKEPEAKRTTIQNEVFRYTVIQAKYGLKAASEIHGNDIITGIQQGSLDRIVAIYDDAFKQMEAAVGDVNSMSRDVEASYRSTGRAYSPATMGKYSALLRGGPLPGKVSKPADGAGTSGECAVFNDPQRSNDLMMADSNRWTALLRRCKQ